MGMAEWHCAVAVDEMVAALQLQEPHNDVQGNEHIRHDGYTATIQVVVAKRHHHYKVLERWMKSTYARQNSPRKTLARCA